MANKIKGKRLNIEGKWFELLTDDIEKNIREFLILIGEDPDREGLIDTPKRVRKAWKEFMAYQEFDTTVFDSDGYDQMIVSKDIKYHTFCEHHLLPFFGKAHIGYIPDKKIVGLSKLARVVAFYSRGLNTQEYLTNNIAEYLNDKLKPKGVGVVMEGRHLCQEMRGIKKKGKMVTSDLQGVFRDDAVRKEFLSLINGG